MFFLALIPWALGIGAMAWIATCVSIHEYRRQIKQENRRATYVGAEKRPEAKLRIEVVKRGCLNITRVDAEEKVLTMYVRNDCHAPIPRGYMEYHWQELAPDRTAIHENYTNLCPTPESPRQVSECVDKLSGDDRAATILVWVVTHE